MGVHVDAMGSERSDIIVNSYLAMGNGTGSTVPPDLTWSNSTITSSIPPSHYEPYEIVWTGEVLFRVVTIIQVMVLTVVGNTTLILIITCHPAERRKRVNVFLVNLALGDLMVCFFTMTTEILFVAFGEWILGAVACKIIVYGQIVTLSSAVYLLTAMSIDRYQVLVQPLRSLTGPPRIWKKVMSAWVLSFVVAIPQMFIFVQTDEGMHVDGSVKHLCRSQGYTAKWQRKVYFTYLTCIILVLPTIIMSFCYINIVRVVWKRTDTDTDKGSMKISFRFRRKVDGGQRNGIHLGNIQSAGGGSGPGSVRAADRLRIPKKLVSSSKRNVVKMTLSVIVGFLICWTPYFVVSLCRIYSDYKLDLKVGLAVAEVLALVHSAMNPILYVIFCTRHAKAALFRMLRCLHKKHPLDGQPMGDEGASEDDNTWSESRGSHRFANITIAHKDRHSACCCTALLHKLGQCLCPCTQTKALGQGQHGLAMGFYQELVPKKMTSSPKFGTNRALMLPNEAHLSDSEFESPISQSSSLERRHTLSYVMSNPNVNPTEQECVSAV